MLLGGLLPIVVPSTRAAEERPPNIILVLADDLGYGDLGSYGQTRIETPALDRMADEGMRFTRHYAGSTVCAPSRCSLLTGYHTGHARIRGNRAVPLLPSDRTVAERLRDEGGYATAVIGKWGLGLAGTSGTPGEQGFETFFGFLDQIRAHNHYPDFLWDNGCQVPLRNRVRYVEKSYAAGVGSVATERHEYANDLFTERALGYVRAHREEPFFLFLSYTIPHANNEFWAARAHGLEVPDLGPYADRDWSEAQRSYAAMVTRLDGYLARLFDELQALGLDERTLVIFTSDNGPHAEGGNDPDFFASSGGLRGGKRDLYEGGLRVPFIARWPGRIAPGSVSDRVSAFWDFFPTACAVAGLDRAPAIDGVSYLPTLLGQATAGHATLYWEFGENDPKQALLRGDEKLIRFLPAGTLELYDLASDPGETRNLAFERPETVEALRALMDRSRTPSRWFPLPEVSPAGDAQP